jgi:hypothetical protein
MGIVSSLPGRGPSLLLLPTPTRAAPVSILLPESLTSMESLKRLCWFWTRSAHQRHRIPTDPRWASSSFRRFRWYAPAGYPIFPYCKQTLLELPYVQCFRTGMDIRRSPTGAPLLSLALPSPSSDGLSMEMHVSRSVSRRHRSVTDHPRNCPDPECLCWGQEQPWEGIVSAARHRLQTPNGQRKHSCWYEPHEWACGRRSRGVKKRHHSPPRLHSNVPLQPLNCVIL